MFTIEIEDGRKAPKKPSYTYIWLVCLSVSNKCQNGSNNQDQLFVANHMNLRKIEDKNFCLLFILFENAQISSEW